MEISTSSPPPPYQKLHFPSFCLPFQVETFTPCLQRRRLLVGDPPSRCSASSIQAGNRHPTPIILLLPRPTRPDRRHERDTFHPNHRPLHEISTGLSHGARSIARTSRSIWQRRSKIAAARADEVVMAANRADPQILEEHLAIC